MQFDIAISFAGEDRRIAEQLASELKVRGLKVFFDTDEQANILGESLPEYLIHVYKDSARYCVVLVSSAYVRKRWTRHEWRAAQARALDDVDRTYILPVRLDESDLPGLLPTTAYISTRDRSIAEIADLIAAKTSSDVELDRQLRSAQDAFKVGEFDRAYRILTQERLDDLRKRVDALRFLADVCILSGHSDEALSILRQLLQVRPNDADAHYILAGAFHRLGRMPEAIEEYEEALRLNPLHKQAKHDLAAARTLHNDEW